MKRYNSFTYSAANTTIMYRPLAILFTCFLTLVGQLCFAGKEGFVNRIEGATIVLNHAPVLIQDDKYGTMLSSSTWQTQWANARVIDRLVVGVDEDLTTTTQADYDLRLTFEIKSFDLTGAASISIGSVDVSYTQGSGVTNDQGTYTFADFHKWSAKLTAVTDISDPQNPLPGAAVPSNLFIEPSIDVVRFYYFDHRFIPSTMTTSVVNVNELRLAWGFIPGAESYDLEWSYVNDYRDGDANSIPLAATDINLSEFDFEHNSTRINTSKQFYDIPLVFERGYLVYRVRGRGWAGTTTIAQVPGKWSSDGQAALNQVDQWPHRFTINDATAHQQLLNWQYNAMYAEEGKKKEMLAYADGSMRSRQAISRLNTNQAVLVGETFYDHQGRAAISTLPTPSGNNHLDYHPEYNKSAITNQAFVRLDFDDEFPLGSCDVTVDAMSTQSGSAKYYSPTNSTETTFQDYIPDAEGYPYVVTEYEPDLSGRIRRQSAPGESHTMNNGHESFYFYGQAQQEELDRLFGLNIGVKSRYKKNMVVDANGQVSVSYMDPYGRVVATALSGVAPDNLTDLTYSGVLINMNVDLLNKTQENDVDDDDDDNLPLSTGRFPLSINDGLQMTTELQVPGQNTPYDFEYDLLGGYYNDACAPTLCYPFIYDLSISVADKCATEVLIDATGGNTIPDGLETTIGVVDVNNLVCQGLAYTNHNLETVLSLGTYSVVKTLVVNENAVNTFAGHYIENAECLLDLADFVDYELDNIDIENCAVTCDECVVSVLTNYGHPAPANFDATLTLDDWNAEFSNLTTQPTALNWEALYQNCTAPCKNADRCDATYELMLQDMRPGGQYGSISPSDPLSVYSLLSQFPPFHRWRYPMPQYEDQNGDLALVLLQETSPGVYDPPMVSGSPIIVSGQPYTTPENLLYLNDFVDAFEISWSKALVSYHPEYCYYEACIKNHLDIGETYTSKEFDELLLTLESFSAADAAFNIGGFNAGAILVWLVANDPYFRSTGFIESSYECGVNLTNLSTNNQNFLSGFSTQLGFNIISEYGNYITSQGTTLSMFDIAVGTQSCAGVYGPCTPSTLGFGATETDLAWGQLRNYYRSKKQQLTEQAWNVIAYENGCENWEIGVSGSYENKTKRWITHDDIAGGLYGVHPGGNIFGQSVAQSQANMYSTTGQCPLVIDVIALLNGLVNAGHFGNTQSSSVALTNFGALNPALYAEIRGISIPDFLNTPFVPQDYSEIVNAGSLEMNLTEQFGTPNACGAFTLDQACLASNGLFWNGHGTTFNVLTFDHITPHATIPGAYNLLATVELLPSNEIKEFLFVMTTCFDLDGCNIPVCDGPKTLANDIHLLLDALALNNDLGNTVQLNIPPYDVIYSGSSIEVLVGASATYEVLSGGLAATIRPDANASSPNVQSGDISLVSAQPWSTFNGYALNSPIVTEYNGVFSNVHMTGSINIGGVPNFETLQFIVEYDNPTGVIRKEFDLCCDGEFSLLADVAQLVGQAIDGSLTLTGGHLYNELGLALYAYLSHTGFSVTPTSTFDLSIDANRDLQVQAGANTFTIAVEDDQGLNLDFADLDDSWGARLDANINPNAFLMNATISGNTQEVIMITGDVQAFRTDNTCETCIPTPLEAASCNKAYNELVAALTARNLPIPTSPVQDPFDPNLYTQGSFEVEFCNRLLKFTSVHYIEYLNLLNILSINNPNWLTIDDFAAINIQGEYSAYEIYVSDMISNGFSAFIETFETFAQNDHLHCAENYVAALVGGASTSISLDDFCTGLENSTTDNCSPFPIYIMETAPAVNPCEEFYTNLATFNAEIAYGSYIEGIRAEFVRTYITEAIATANEQLRMKYEDAEFHHTLFYYDQGGNLVRTVPPQGIDETFFNAVSANLNGEQDQIKNDRNNNTNTAGSLPSHNLATTYNYNTLNQLAANHTPDGGKSQLYYDKLSRVVLSQDARQIDAAQYSNNSGRRYSYM
jgi:YD repeat-containing protein